MTRNKKMELAIVAAALIGVFLLLQLAPGDTVDALMAQMGGGDAGFNPRLRVAVDKAKGVLMVARGLDEDAAYHAIRKLAMERGQPMAKIARDIIDMAKVLL